MGYCVCGVWGGGVGVKRKLNENDMTWCVKEKERIGLSDGGDVKLNSRRM